MKMTFSSFLNESVIDNIMVKVRESLYSLTESGLLKEMVRFFKNWSGFNLYFDFLNLESQLEALNLYKETQK